AAPIAWYSLPATTRPAMATSTVQPISHDAQKPEKLDRQRGGFVLEVANERFGIGLFEQRFEVGVDLEEVPPGDAVAESPPKGYIR
ncbi:MAG TPA: hypothetical protein VGC23_04090, partial [Vicinamibacterales bacterium]